MSKLSQEVVKCHGVLNRLFGYTVFVFVCYCFHSESSTLATTTTAAASVLLSVSTKDVFKHSVECGSCMFWLHSENKVTAVTHVKKKEIDL